MWTRSPGGMISLYVFSVFNELHFRQLCPIKAANVLTWSDYDKIRLICMDNAGATTEHVLEMLDARFPEMGNTSLPKRENIRFWCELYHTVKIPAYSNHICPTIEEDSVPCARMHTFTSLSRRQMEDKILLNRRFIEDEQLLHWRQIEDKSILNIRSIEDAAVHMQSDQQKKKPIRPRDAQLEDDSKRRWVIKRELLDPQERVHVFFARTRH